MNPRSRLIHSVGLHQAAKVVQMACQALETVDVHAGWELVTELLSDGTFSHHTAMVWVEKNGVKVLEPRTFIHCGHRNGKGERLITDPDLLKRNLERSIGDLPPILRRSLLHFAGTKYRFNEEIVGIFRDMQSNPEDSKILIGRSHEDHGSDLDLLMQEWARGVREFYQPMRLESRRQRCHVDGAGVSYQGSDSCRGIIEYAEGKRVGGAELEYVLEMVGDEFDLTLEKAYNIRAAGADFFRNPQKYGIKKKPVQAFAHSIGLLDAVAGLPVYTIGYMDASQSGFQGSAMTFGCQTLASLTNLMGGSKQDFYGTVLGNVRLPDTLEKYEDVFRTRDMSKFLTTRIGYGAARQSLRAALLFKDAKKLDCDVINQFGCLSDQALKLLASRNGIAILNPDFSKVWVELGWQMAFMVTGAIAREWEDSIYTISPRLREGMQLLRLAASNLLEDGNVPQWVSLTGNTYRLFAAVPDKEQPTVRLRQKIDGKPVEVTVRPMKNGATASMASPDFMHDAFDATDMHLESVNCSKNGINLSGIHDARGTHYADVLVVKDISRETYKVVGESLPVLFETFLASAGIKDPNRTGGRKLDLSGLDDAKYFIH